MNNVIDMQKSTDIRFPIYLDNQATTPMDPRVLDKMMPYFTEKFGNPHSRSHAYGWEAEAGIELAREQVAELINANPKEVVFTSGATEANNIAIKGVAEFYGAKKKHIITAQTEHKCVLESCRYLEQKGFDITYLPVQTDGLIDLDVLKAAMREDTLLVSIMMVNNEIGVVQPVAEIGKLCRANGTFFHTDAAQSFGKMPIDIEAMNIDLMSISGHKIYGPKGVGALYVRRRPRVRIKSILSGGGQERGFRSGTLPTPMVVGLGEAARIAKAEMSKDTAHIKELSDYFLSEVMDKIPDVVLNGSREQRITGNLNLSFSYIEGESMIMALKELAVSSGSACTSASLEPSYVLRAIGVGEDMAHTSIRFGFGRFTTMAEVEYAVTVIKASINKLREMSPLWEMAQEGIDISKIEWAGH